MKRGKSQQSTGSYHITTRPGTAAFNNSSPKLKRVYSRITKSVEQKDKFAAELNRSTKQLNVFNAQIAAL